MGKRLLWSDCTGEEDMQHHSHLLTSFLQTLELVSVQFMFTDGKRVLDKSVAPNISNPVFHTTKLDHNSNAVLVNLHHIIPK